MRLLTFQARRFAWRPFAKTVETAADVIAGGEATEAVVAWIHAEASDVEDRRRVFRHALKHIKWIANKRGLRQVVLHFFAHLGGENAEPDFARAFIVELAERLQSTGYTVSVTPCGYFCAWELDVYGDSLAKVYKTI
jgi:hypothetical protein